VSVTARQLNRATLSRQLLLRREALDVAVAVHRLVALQAQEPAGPYLALWGRVAGFEPASLDRAFADHHVVRASLMRITMQAVAAQDYPAFHETMQVTLRAARLNDPRFTSTGLTAADADALIPAAVAFSRSGKSNAQMEGWVQERLGAPKPRVWWALRHYGPFVHAPIDAPWSFGSRSTYMGALEQSRPGDPEASTECVVLRYLEGFGPATARDIAAFGMINAPLIKAAIQRLGDRLVRIPGPGTADLLDVRGGGIPDEDVAAPPRLLPMWDQSLVGYADKTRLTPAEYRPLIARINGDVLPAVLVDGLVAGVWRPVEEGIEITAFHRLTDQAWEGLESEARGLWQLLADRDAKVYGRYGHWWKQLPKGETRVV